MLISENISEIISKYILTINNFTKFFFNNITVYKNVSYIEILYIKGLTLIHNIYNISLLYLDNLVDIYNISEKGYVYYIEFVNQINLSSNYESNFDLTLKDAIIFSYKKTVFSLDNKIITENNDYVKNKISITNKLIFIINKLNIINNYNIYYSFDHKLFKTYNSSDNDNKNLLENINKQLQENNNDLNKMIKKIINSLEINTLLYENISVVESYLDNMNVFLQVICNYFDNKNNTDNNIYINFTKNFFGFFEKYIGKKIYTKKIFYETTIDMDFFMNISNNTFTPVLNTFK